MKLYILILLLLFTKISFSKNLFETNEYVLEFTSYNISLDREKKINEIKIRSFKHILNNILTKEDIVKINTNNILFINNFILNIKINNEKIINNNYYSIVNVNFNKNLILDFLISNKISFVDYLPDKLLVIILEQDGFQNYFLSRNNNFYKYLIDKNESSKNLFVIPNLDHNDRYLYQVDDFLNDNFIKNKKLNIKYKSDYQLLIHSIKDNNIYNNNVFIFHENKKYFVFQNKVNKMNYEVFFNQILENSLDKWRHLNKIDTSILNTVECNIVINNIHQLSYVRGILKENKIIKNFYLKKITLNKNSYKILYFGNKKIFQNSLKKNRLNLTINNSNSCSIKLI